MSNIEPKLLLDYMHRFVGFGAPKASMWFVGLEQSGGESLGELRRLLSAWEELGLQPFVDLKDYCELIGEKRWHGDNASIQPTLGKLVRLVLASQGTTPTSEAVRSYQANELGHLGSSTVLAELMPLPSRNVKSWIYSRVAGVPHLKTRQAYVNHYRLIRCELLRSAIRVAAPRAVVFVGVSEMAKWAEIAETRFAEGSEGAWWARAGTTEFVVVKHPTAFGANNSYFEAVGSSLGACQ